MFPTAQCVHGCKHGECVGPNKCKCFPGYAGKTCNQGRQLGVIRHLCVKMPQDLNSIARLQIWTSAAWNLVPVSTAAWTAMEVTSATAWTGTQWPRMAPAPVSIAVLLKAKKWWKLCIYLFDVSRLQNLLSRSLSVRLRGGPGGDPLPLPVSRAAARTGWANLCRWGTRVRGLWERTAALDLILQLDDALPCLSADQGFSWIRQFCNY